MTIALSAKRTVAATVGGRELVFETGHLAKQADGAVVVRSGDTMVLATAVGRAEGREGADFFPLTVDVEERMYAAGKIPGGFFKREGRPTERAILNARMIDRPIRPLWPKGYKNEVQVIATILSTDLVHAHDVLAINGASAALMISSLPFLGPVGAVRIGMDEDRGLVVDPTLPDLEQSALDLLVVGTKDAITMVEAGADEITEEELLAALEVAHDAIRGICDAQERLRVEAGKPKLLDEALTGELEGSHGTRIRERVLAEGPQRAAALVEELESELCPPISIASTEADITRRLQVRSSLAQLVERARLDAVVGPVRAQFEQQIRELTEAEQDSKELKSAKRDVLVEHIVSTVELPWLRSEPADGEDATAPVLDAATRSLVKKAADAIYKEIVRRKIAVEKRRPDGRGAEEIRPISCEVDVAPRTHGSALFTRGQTQIMTLLTLGTAKEGQRIDDLSLEQERRFMHHYNFPPFSVGETGFMRGPKRRDIGHGNLAQRALEPMIPDAAAFPYTIRLVSETLESNGSSSMGSVCASTLALLAAGVRMKAPVAGIAMGLIKEGDDHVVLTDIQGAEDHLGDMDFKVAGTRNGVTALQMDIKITGVTREIMRAALAQAKQAREFILDRMAGTLAEARDQLAEHAPRITSVQIDPEQIGLVIGKGGETIRGLEAEYEVQIDIEEDGTVLIYASDGIKAEGASSAIRALTKEPEAGDTYTGRIVRITEFGAFVELKKGLDGLLHISNIGPGRVESVEDVLARGDTVTVHVIEVDKARGRIALRLVHKHEDDRLVEPAELVERAKAAAADRPPREERPDRGDRGDRGRGGRDRGGRPPRRERERDGD